jgi:hypothetical protein
MTSAGWIIMSVSVCGVLLLNAFCMFRVLTMAPAEVTETMKTPLDIDTGDTENAD